MPQLFMIILLLMLISLLMMFMNFLISKKIINNREKLSPFECGFDPMSNNRSPLSIHFFMISLIFLIFDVEIALLIPLMTLSKYFNIFIISYTLIFMLMLTYGLYMEYLEQSIDWKL